jgi:hypothetical protein
LHCPKIRFCLSHRTSFRIITDSTKPCPSGEQESTCGSSFDPAQISAIIDASLGTGQAIQYRWKANGVIIPGATGSSYNPGVITTNTNYVREASSNGTTWLASNTVTVTLNPVPVAVVNYTNPGNPGTSAGNAATPGTQVSITAGGGGTYLWPDNGSTAATRTVAATTGNTVYNVQVTNTAGCSSTAAITVYGSGPVVVPDLTPTLDIDNLIFGPSVKRDFVVNIYEINGSPAGNPISIRLSKPSAFTITYPATSGVSNVYGGITNENSNWTFTETANFITATAKAGVSIPANGMAVLGFTLTRKAGTDNGIAQNLSAVVVGSSGGETNTTNNSSVTSATTAAN